MDGGEFFGDEAGDFFEVGAFDFDLGDFGSGWDSDRVLLAFQLAGYLK